jgi:ABC-type dipeptide/oligopeptide/nickel transport system ATPase subunit
MGLIEINKLSKTYESGEECVLALVDVDLKIEKGEFVSAVRNKFCVC